MPDWEPKLLEPQKGAGILPQNKEALLLGLWEQKGGPSPETLYLGCPGPFQSTLVAQFPSMPLYTQHRWLFEAYCRLIGTV